MNKFILLFLATLLVSGCGFIDEAKDNMNHMRNGMDNTNEGIRLQKVGVAKENLEKEENAQILSPLPFALMGYAKLFAENATNEELAAQIYLYLKEIDEGTYPIVTETVEIDGEMQEVIAQSYIDMANHKKLHKLSAAQAISGLVPQDIFERLVVEYVDGEGRYKKTVQEMMMLRYQFLRDVLLNASLLGESLVSVGGVEKAEEYIAHMHWVANRTMTNTVAVQIKGFIGDQIEDYSETLTPEAAKASMESMLKKAISKARRFSRKQLAPMSDGHQKVVVGQRFEQANSALLAMESYWKNMFP